MFPSDLDRGFRFQIVEILSEDAYAFEGRGDDLLSRVPGIDCHKKDAVDAGKQVLELGEGRRWVDSDAGGCASVADLHEYAVGVGAGLDVNADRVATGFDEAVDVAFGPLDHEVGVAGQGRAAFRHADEIGAEGVVGDEGTVHDVEVELLTTGSFEGLDGFFETAEGRAHDAGRPGSFNHGAFLPG